MRLRTITLSAALLSSGCHTEAGGIRHGDETGTLHTDIREGQTCGERPTNVTDQREQALTAAIGGALKDAKSSPNFSASFSSTFKDNLTSVLASGTVANDLAMIEYSVCKQCETLLLSPTQCAAARTEAIKAYKEAPVSPTVAPPKSN